MSTITTIRPNGTITSSNTTLTGSGSYEGAESDNSDGSYLGLPIVLGVGSYAQLDFGDPTIPGGAVITAVTPRARINLNDAVPGQNNYRYNLQVGSASFGDEGMPLYYLSGGGWGTLTGNRHTAQPDGSAWTAAALNALNMQVKRLVGDGANNVGTLLVSEMYIDVEYNYIPSATGTGPNGNSNSSRPTFSWSFSDADGDGQAAFRIKVYSSNQYSAPGFNPDVSSPYVDSGVINSTSLNWQSSVDLINGNTYRAYISVYDGISGWSTFGSYSYVTILLDPIGAPFISASNVDNTAKTITLTLQDRQNMINASISDVEDGLGYWANLANTTIVQSTDYGLDSSHSIKVTTAGSMVGDNTIIGMNFVNFTTDEGGVSGQDYTAAISVLKPSGTPRVIRLDTTWFDAGGSALLGQSGPPITERIGEWTTCYCKSTAPANAIYSKIELHFYDVAGSEVHYVDRATVIPFAINMIDDPNFEFDDGTGGAPGVAADWQAYASGTVDQSFAIDISPDNVIAGNQSQHIVTNSMSGGSYSGIYTKRFIPVKVGQVYTISVWAKSDRAVPLEIFHNGFGIAGPTNLAANQWQRVIATVTISSSTPSQLYLRVGQACSLWIGHVQMELGNTATAENTNRKYWTRGALTSLQRFQVQRSVDRVNWTDITNRLSYDLSQPLSSTVLTDANSSDYFQSITVYDQDAPLGTTVYYRTRSIAVVAGSTLTSGWSVWVSQATASPDPLYWFMKVPQLPYLNHKFGFKGPDWNRKSPESAAFFSPISRPRKVKVRDVIYGDEFQLTASVISQEEINALNAIRMSQQTVLLQSTDGRQWFCDFDNEVNFHEIVTDSTNPYEEISITFVEVDAPYV